MAARARRHGRPLVVGLTGGIASGKTAVSDRFARLGVPVIDTDRIARELVEPGMPALDAIVTRFGRTVLDSAGRLDRAGLRARVFGDPQARRDLEAILHPAIRAEAMRRVDALDAPYCILVVPLLVEGGMHRVVDRVLVVDVPPETQIARLMARDGSTTEQAKAILAAQASRDQRLAAADDVIDNAGPQDALDAAVTALDARYRGLA